MYSECIIASQTYKKTKDCLSQLIFSWWDWFSSFAFGEQRLLPDGWNLYFKFDRIGHSNKNLFSSYRILLAEKPTEVKEAYPIL